ncbi:hypothetical protein PP634_gp62 [Arthrobacter phage Richie]|uniref:Uncharacterized protein n=1 Tax=Arthrobacter phage Richie TaxID=2419967 RepID=A0A3G2KIS2_9CAUD|nr:hypothetical protein PP634_gp62 [Arthrobacter phage Richie]AYN58888.1 hypothetical protein PBI_RICHIE_62 [Arthrobacter phage Richie]
MNAYTYKGTRFQPPAESQPVPPRKPKTRPEEWHARCLRDEAEQLTIAVRMLEFAAGYHNGVNEAQVAA